LFAATRSKVDENGQRIWCDAYIQSVYVSTVGIVQFKVRRLKSVHKLLVWLFLFILLMQEKYEQLKAETDVQIGSAANDHLFFKTCGGWSENDTLYELGRDGPAMFDRPAEATRSSCSTLSAYSSPLVTQLQDQLQTMQNELQTTQARLHSTEEELRSTREELEVTRN